MFEAQLQLAIQYQRPISIHCVRAHSLLLETLSRYFPGSTPHRPGIVLHSYGGSAEMVNQLIPFNCYFSLCGAIETASKKVIKMVKTIPPDRLLVESDAPDQTPSLGALNSFLTDVMGPASEQCSAPGTPPPPQISLPQLFARLLSPIALQTVTASFVPSVPSPSHNDPDNTSTPQHCRSLENECSTVLFVVYVYCTITGQINDASAVQEVLHNVYNNGCRIFPFRPTAAPP